MDAQIPRKKKLKTSTSCSGHDDYQNTSTNIIYCHDNNEDDVLVLAAPPPQAAGPSSYTTTSTTSTAAGVVPHQSSNHNDHKEDIVTKKRPHAHDDEDGDYEYRASSSRRRRTEEAERNPPRRDDHKKNHYDKGAGEEEQEERQDQQHDIRRATSKQKWQLPEEEQQQQQQNATSVTTEGAEVAKEQEDCAPPPPPLLSPYHQPKHKHKELDQQEVEKHHRYQTASPVVKECALDEEKPHNRQYDEQDDCRPRGRSARLPPTASGSAFAADDTTADSRVRRTGAAGVLPPATVENHAATTNSNRNNKDEEEQAHLRQEQQPLMVMDAPENNNTSSSYDSTGPPVRMGSVAHPSTATSTDDGDKKSRPTTTTSGSASDVDEEKGVAGSVAAAKPQQHLPGKSSNKVTYPRPLNPETTKENDNDSVLQKDDGLEKRGTGGGVVSKIRTATTSTTSGGGTSGPTDDREQEDRGDQRNNLLPMPSLGASEQSDVTMKEDEGETVSINVARAQHKMMRFFFGNAAADEIAKNEGVLNNDQAKMKERKVTAKDGSRRMYIRFPHKLMYTLECGDYSNILSWNFNGASFKIEDRYLFETKVLPEIFKDAKFSSFRRKLNRWYFKRHRSEKVFTVSHPYFRQGNYSLCDLMACGDSKQCELQEPNLESIPPALLGHQAMYPPETSTLVSRSAMHVAQPATLGVEKYSNFQHGDAVSGFRPSHMMLPSTFDPATGLIFQHQQGATSGNPLLNDNGSASMPYNITKSPPWMLHGSPNPSNVALQSSYSGFNNMGVGDCSFHGNSLSSENSLARNNGRHVLPSESAVQVIQAGNQVFSDGYLPAQGLHPVNRVGDGIGASLLSANQPFPPNNSNYLGTPQMSNFDTNYGIHASFVDSQPQILATQTAVPQYVPLSAPTENNTGRYNVQTLSPSTYALHTLRMPPFAMTALSQQQQALNSEQNRLSGTGDNVPEYMRSAN